MEKHTVQASVILISAIILQTIFQLFAIRLNIANFVVAAWFMFFAIPICIAISLNIPLKNVGLQLGTLPKNKKVLATTFIILICIAATSLLPASREYYINKIPENHVFLFVFTVYAILYSAEEFFFRGYLLFGTKPLLGKWSNVIQTILFTFFHIGKPSSELILSIFAGLLFGKIALESKSFIIPFLLHFLLGIVVKVVLFQI